MALLALMLGDCSFVERQPMRYVSHDEACLSTVASAAWYLFGITAARDERDTARVVSLRLHSPHDLTHGRLNPIAEWLDSMALLGRRNHEKFVPDWVFSLPREQVALFLRTLWTTDCVPLPEHRQGPIRYFSTSRRLIDDVARVLLGFEVDSHVRGLAGKGRRDGWILDIVDPESRQRFIEDVGVPVRSRDVEPRHDGDRKKSTRRGAAELIGAGHRTRC